MTDDWMARRDRQGLAILGSVAGQRKALQGREEHLMLARVVTNVSIPPAVGETLACNPRFAQPFFVGIGRTLHRAMTDPRTRPLVWSDAAVKERLDVIYDLVTRLHGDGNISILATMDRLWGAVLARLQRAQHPDDAAEEQIAGSAMEPSTDGLTGNSWACAESKPGTVRMNPGTEDFREE